MCRLFSYINSCARKCIAKSCNNFYKQIFIYLTLFQTVTHSALSQANFQFRIFTQEDGLASGTLKGIGQDSTGFLWLMSENGLSRFDGYAFKVFRHDVHNKGSISSSNIYSISVDKNNRIIFNTENSISQYNPDSNTFKSLISSQDKSDMISYFMRPAGCWIIKQSELVFIQFSNNNKTSYPFPLGFNLKKANALREINGTLWLNNGSKILSFDTARKIFKPVSIQYLKAGNVHSNSEVSYFFSTDNSSICFFSNNGLFKLNKESNVFFQYAQCDFDLPTGEKIRKALLVNNKYLAIETMHQVYSVDVRTGKTVSIPLKDIRSTLNKSTQTFEMIPSANSTVWVSTSNAGVFHVDLEKASVMEHLYNDANNINSLASDNIEFMMESQGVLWVTSPGIGLLKIERDIKLLKSYRPPGESISIQSSLNTNVRAIGELDKDNLLIGTLGGLYKFNKTSHTFSSLLSPVDGKPVMSNTSVSAIITDSKKNIWISAWGLQGVTIVNFESKKLLTIIPDENALTPDYRTIRSMYLDSHNYLWLGTDGNVIYRLNTNGVDLDKKTTFHFEKFSGKITTADTLIFNLTFTFSENKNKQVLIGTQDGFYTYDYPTARFKRYSNHTANNSSISEDDVRCFHTDSSGNLWIGTHGGGLNKSNQSLTAFNYYNRENGLPDNCIYTILDDKNGNLWLATNRGISCFNPTTKYVRNYSLKDGLQNYEFNTNAAFKTSSDELVFGGVNGFNIFHPDSVKMISGSPKVVISEFKINDVDYPVSGNISLNYDQNSVSFQFAALSYVRSRENLYAYKLDGVNKNWVYCERRRFSNYAGLAPGNYTFHVKACNYNGVWNEQGVSLHFSIAEPFWKTWWFKMVIILSFLSIAYLFFRYRLKQQLKMELLRNKIARDLHDEIGSNLSSISLFSAAAKERYSKESSRISPLLQKISEYAQSSQESINDIVWVINARNDAFENIIIRMRKRAAEIFEATNINLHINLDEALNKVKVKMESRQNFYLIYKEALNNVVKYSNCKNVWISLKLKNSIVTLTIKDDGTGFDLDKIAHKNGIVNMQKRAELLKGYLDINSFPQQGTSIILTFHI